MSGFLKRVWQAAVFLDVVGLVVDSVEELLVRVFGQVPVRKLLPVVPFLLQEGLVGEDPEPIPVVKLHAVREGVLAFFFDSTLFGPVTGANPLDDRGCNRTFPPEIGDSPANLSLEQHEALEAREPD